MTTPERELNNVEYAVSVALGHIRNATERLLGEDDPTTDSLLLGLNGLDLQTMFGDVWPAWVPNERTALESLACAQATLAGVLDHVPLAIWAGLRSLRQQVGDGHR